MQQNIIFAKLLVTALSLIALSGCVDTAPAANSSLYVKDALTEEVIRVDVTFTNAQVRTEAGWVTVFDDVMTINLLELSAADARENLADFHLEAGTYEGLRIAVSTVEVTYEDGSNEMLNVFGNLVQISEAFTATEDGVDILVDFDLDAGVDLEAGTYTPVVKEIQVSSEDSDGDGIDDVADTDDDDDGVLDNEDVDRDGDGEKDEVKQVYADNRDAACEAEYQEDLADIEADYNESIEEAEAERQEAYDEADQQYQEDLLNGNITTAEENRQEARQKADEEYQEAVAEAEAERDEELAEAEADYTDCLTDDEDDDTDDDDGDDKDDDTDDEDEDDN